MHKTKLQVALEMIRSAKANIAAQEAAKTEADKPSNVKPKERKPKT